jgi:hypothetical protein
LVSLAVQLVTGAPVEQVIQNWYLSGPGSNTESEVPSKHQMVTVTLAPTPTAQSKFTPIASGHLPPSHRQNGFTRGGATMGSPMMGSSALGAETVSGKPGVAAAMPAATGAAPGMIANATRVALTALAKLFRIAMKTSPLVSMGG